MTNVVEGISESGIAMFGDMTEAGGVTALDQHGVKTGKGPNMIYRGETVDFTDPRPIASGVIGTHARNSEQDGGR
jgi:hypothetical protein